MAEKTKTTAAEKAQAALDAANRKLERATKRLEKADAEYDAALDAKDTAEAERDYAAKHPALPNGAAQPAAEDPSLDATPDAEAVAAAHVTAADVKSAHVTAADVKSGTVSADAIGGPGAPTPQQAAEGSDPFAEFAQS